MLSIDSRAPAFALPDQEERETSLPELLRSGPLMLYFYPADFTPHCTRQACAFRDRHESALSNRLSIVGISPQPPSSHRRFGSDYQLPFKLLSDPSKTVIRMYGANGPFGIGVRRVSYLIDPFGIIKAALRADFRIRRHEKFLTEAMSRLANDSFSERQGSTHP